MKIETKYNIRDEVWVEWFTAPTNMEFIVNLKLLLGAN